jgi:O-antigen ligase
VVVGGALVRYLLGTRRIDQFEGYHLSWPLGYANAVGILSALGAVLALAPALDGGTRARRALGAASVPLFAAALELTGSNASWAALAAGMVVAAAFAPRAGVAVRTAALLAIPAGAAAALAGLGAFSEQATPRFPRLLLALAVVAAAAVAVLAERAGHRIRVPPDLRLGPATALLALAGVAAAAALGASTQPRRSYYDVAWHEYTAHPALGSGAGTFGRAWIASGLPVRYGGALDAHSLYLETLAELGPVGLALVLALLLYPLARRRRLRAAPGAPAAAGAAVAFLAHVAVDWDWELPAVVVAGLACLAAVLVADGSRLEGRAPAALRAAALAAALVLGALSLAGAASSTKPSALSGASGRASGRASSAPSAPRRRSCPSKASRRARDPCRDGAFA